MNKGIWQHREIKKEIDSNEYLTLGEGGTELENLSDDVWLKREDKNPTGSWKDRGTAWKLTSLYSQGINEAVISSSGNAAISLLTYCNELQMEFKVHVVVSTKVNENKKKLLEELAGDKHKIYFDQKARRKSSQISAEKQIPLLRASTDSDILKGYWSLGFEIYKELSKDKDNVIFCPVSSGTGLVGMVQGLFTRIEDEYKMPRIIVCQTEQVHPVKAQFSEMHSEKRIGKRSIEIDISNKEPLADAIVDKTVLRMPQILKILDQTRGKAISISNAQLKEAKKMVEEKGLELSYTSLLSVAGYYQLKDSLEDTNVICIASGR